MRSIVRDMEHAEEISGAVGGAGARRASTARRVLAIARNTFREAVRDRVLYNLVLFVLLLTGGAVFLGELSAAQEAKIIVDMGLSAMLLFGVFIAIFVGVGLVYKEIERRTIYAIFSKPVGRGEFLAGKYLGLCLTLAVNVAVMGAGVSLALLYVRGGYDPLALNIWPAVALVYVELMIVVAVALLFSSFSTPALSALLTFSARASSSPRSTTCCRTSRTTHTSPPPRTARRPRPPTSSALYSTASPTSPCCSRPPLSSSNGATSNERDGGNNRRKPERRGGLDGRLRGDFGARVASWTHARRAARAHGRRRPRLRLRALAPARRAPARRRPVPVLRRTLRQAGDRPPPEPRLQRPRSRLVLA
ncbi:MAG: hypothetical protein DMF66_00510, partial [Acidobacteria bacterium]